jgi:hypothetical protein
MYLGKACAAPTALGFFCACVPSAYATGLTCAAPLALREAKLDQWNGATEILVSHPRG